MYYQSTMFKEYNRMKSSIIQAIIFSLLVHLIVIGGTFAYLEYQKGQDIKQGYFASTYGFEIVGGTMTSLLVMTYIVFILVYLIFKRIVSKLLT